MALSLLAGLLKLREQKLLGYGFALAMCIAGLLLRLALDPAGRGAPFATFMPGILLSAFAGGVGPGLLATFMSALLANYFFMPPAGYYTFWPRGWVVVTAFCLVNACIVLLMNAAVVSGLKLSRAMALLRSANATLEARVAARSSALLQAQEQLRQAQKMEAIGQLTGGIAHDFNNLLTSITGSLELVQSRLAQGRVGELPRFLDAAQDSAGRAASLTRRLLAFARQQALEPRETNLNALVEGMEDLIRRTIAPGIAFETRHTRQRGIALVDPNQLEHALLNLCINASDAMPSGGTLLVSTGRHALDKAAAAALDLPPGEYVSLCVRDNGTGMPQSVIDRAFDPFFTTKPPGRGTGLGLSIVYGFVRQSGGQVQIQSTLGHGTSITLYLPRHPGAGIEDTARPALATAAAVARARHALVVDDDAAIRMLIVDQLGELGIAASAVEDGPSGLHLVQTQPIDLLITDIKLPGGLDGHQLAEAAREALPGLPVLFVTGLADGSHRHSLPAGMHTLAKPFAMATLAARVREILAMS
jgi:signal transduction histidine kinase